MTGLTRIDQALTSARAGSIRFCSRCGEPAPAPPAGEPIRGGRVCAACGMGVLLSCARQALPGAGAAFLIATGDLEVSAISQAAERLFGPETEVLGAPLVDLLGSPLGEARLAATVVQAALRKRPPEVLPVNGLTPEARRAGVMGARISTCGRPRAALITVEPHGSDRP
jgi:PAS domain-containing protein